MGDPVAGRSARSVPGASEPGLSAALPPPVERAVERYLAMADRLLPGWITGFWVVGSTALGAYRPGRSDIDVVAVVDGPLDRRGAACLRAVHAGSGLGTATVALARGRSPLSGTCNGSFLDAAALDQPLDQVVPVASHIGHTFRLGGTSGPLFPVDVKVLVERGITVRGPDPATLGAAPGRAQLQRFNLENLERYWGRWAAQVRCDPGVWFRWRPRWSTAWGVLGPPRLHATIATGEVISKEQAGAYALDVLPARWHPLIAEALAFWRGEPPARRWTSAERRYGTAAFVEAVVASAGELATPSD